MTDLKAEEQTVLQRLERSEQHWHWVKAGLVIVACAITVFAVIYSNHQVSEQTKSNQRVIDCALHAFTPQNYPKAETIINQCLKDK